MFYLLTTPFIVVIWLKPKGIGTNHAISPHTRPCRYLLTDRRWSQETTEYAMCCLMYYRLQREIADAASPSGGKKKVVDILQWRQFALINRQMSFSGSKCLKAVQLLKLLRASANFGINALSLVPHNAVLKSPTRWNKWRKIQMPRFS